ncbi:hypothetical protein [Croceivirga thetidis]|uniref:Uncharacterized protein n=1 Tax=Croceivirga thetidis TaxID=2721623 RepID=A0ABX1GS19_9FLAO|nr:hypothetical protein [Croceivirga thetidis]NKI31557.1 hypothetical protein [Croceivirga thetidis]
MIRILLVVTMILGTGFLFGQTQNHQIEFQHFTESRGDSETDLILELPYSELVTSHRPLSSNSGLGKTFNFNGSIVVVDYIDVLQDVSMQVVLRREDGKDFYGYRPTLKAILKPTR